MRSARRLVRWSEGYYKRNSETRGGEMEFWKKDENFSVIGESENSDRRDSDGILTVKEYEEILRMWVDMRNSERSVRGNYERMGSLLEFWDSRWISEKEVGRQLWAWVGVRVMSEGILDRGEESIWWGSAREFWMSKQLWGLPSLIEVFVIV